MTTEVTPDYRWWLTGDTIPADWHAKVADAMHAGGAEQCACDSGDEHAFMLESYSDLAVHALEAAASLAADAERERVLAELRDRVAGTLANFENLPAVPGDDATTIARACHISAYRFVLGEMARLEAGQ